MRRHETDAVSLVLGLVMVAVAALWALVSSGVLSVPAASVVGPVVLVVAGAVGFVTTLRGRGPTGRDG